LRQVRVFAIFTAIAAVLLTGCSGGGSGPDHQAEWREILEQKKAATAPDATADHRQRYADSVRDFVTRHPNHGRAKEVWFRIQLEFADELMKMGRPHEAVRFYRSVLLQDPGNEQAVRGWDAAARRLAIGRDRLAKLQRGMSEREVAAILGRPMPGWTVRQTRRSTEFEAWYYRTATGGVAAVYFREGRVLAAEPASNERVSRAGA
jgi:hypothetical protein